MWPASSVSGFYLSHPEARYFRLGRIERDQVEDYARRKGQTVTWVEKWLASSLAYDPEAERARRAAASGHRRCLRAHVACWDPDAAPPPPAPAPPPVSDPHA